MSKVTTIILFATIALILAATYLGLPYFGDGAGLFLIGGLCFCVFHARRQAALFTYVLSESQIVSEPEVRKPAAVPQGLGEPTAEPARARV